MPGQMTQLICFVETQYVSMAALLGRHVKISTLSSPLAAA